MVSKDRLRAIEKEHGIPPDIWLWLINQFKSKCAAGIKCKSKKTVTPDELEPDHIWSQDADGIGHICNIQPLCRSCNGSKQNKYIDFRGDVGKLVELYRQFKKGQSYQLCLAFPVARIDFKKLDKPQIQPDFFYVLSDDRKREVEEIQEYVDLLNNPDMWNTKQINWDIVEKSYKLIDKILRQQISFYVSKTDYQPWGMRTVLNTVAPRYHPEYLRLSKFYCAVNEYWVEKFNSINGTSFNADQFYFAVSEFYSWGDIESNIDKLRKIKLDNKDEYKRANLFAGLIRTKIWDWIKKIDGTDFFGIDPWLLDNATEIIYRINRYYS